MTPLQLIVGLILKFYHRFYWFRKPFVRLSRMTPERFANNHHINIRSSLRWWNQGADVTKPHDKEGDRLAKQVNEVPVLPKHNIIACTH